MNKLLSSKHLLNVRFIAVSVGLLLVATVLPSIAYFSGDSPFVITTPNASSTVGTDFEVTWNKLSGASAYKLQLSSTDDPFFEGPDFVRKTSSTSSAFSDVYEMTYIARVVAKNSDGKRIAVTPTIAFTVNKSQVVTTTVPTTQQPATTSRPTTTVAPVTTTTTTQPPATNGVWTPKPGTTWYWQLNGTINENINVAMYDIDLFEAVPSARSYSVPGFGTVNVSKGQNAGVIDRLHAKGRVVICYVDTGAAENSRPDINLIPTSVRGTVAEASDGTQWDERWLDTRQSSWSSWAPIMWARFDLAKSIGCDGVEPDQNNHVGNSTGFPESVAIDRAWYLEVAKQAHLRGLSVGQKNGIEALDATLVKAFDWHLNEECNQYNECNVLTPFISAGKAVFNAEYPNVKGGASQSLTCSNAKKYNLSSMGYPLVLGGGYFFDCLTGLSVPTGTTK